MANEAERLHKLEQSNGMLKQRVEFLEERLTDLSALVRTEVMRTLGITFGQISESMLTAVAANHRYSAKAVGDNEPINDQTFYAVREADGWKFRMMHEGVMTPFNLTNVVEAMRDVMIAFVTEIPEGVDSAAFNIYKEQKHG